MNTCRVFIPGSCSICNLECPVVPASFLEDLCTGFNKKSVICAKPEWFSGLLNTGTFCLSAHGVLSVLKTRGVRSRKGDTLWDRWVLKDGPHSVPRVTAPNRIQQESGTAGNISFSDLCNRYFLQASDFHLCPFHHQNHSSPLQGEIIWLRSLQCQAEGCWTQGDKCSYYNRESSFPMIFTVVAGFPRLSKCYSVS